MRLPDFALERFYARWEFNVRHNLSASDVEPIELGDLLDLADDVTRALWDRLSLGYTESAGHPQLRAEIAVTWFFRRSIAAEVAIAQTDIGLASGIEQDEVRIRLIGRL